MSKVVAAICAASLIILFVSTASAQTNVVARWTPAQASAKMRGKCVGLGKPVNGRYNAFKCSPGVGGVVWAKVRPDGAKLCWSRTSLAAIPAYCMVVPGTG